jgi:hydrogenase maturation protease
VSAQAPSGGFLVLGLGNLLCGDDGLGVTAVTAVARRYQVPDGVQLLDGGTLGLSLLGWLAEAEDILLVDAIRDGAAPGTLVRLEGDEVEHAARERLSVHQIGVADLLDSLRLLDAWPRRLALLGLEPEHLDLGLSRSHAVDRALPILVDAVVAEIRARGHHLTPRTDHDESADLLDARRAARSLGL